MTTTEARKALEGVWAELKAVDEQLRLANEARAKLRRSFQTLTAVERMIAEMEETDG